MQNLHLIATTRGDGWQPELQALFDRIAADPRSECFVKADGMTQSGPDPVGETGKVVSSISKRAA